MKKLLFMLALPTCLFAQNAVNFDGSDDYIESTYTGISGNGSRTVEAWIRTTANCVPSSGGHQRVIVDWGTGATGSRFTLNLLFNNSIRLEASGNGISGTTAINDGQWHHVAAVYNSALSTDQIKLYIDGNLETSGNLTVPINTSSGTSVLIGSRIDGINKFEGDIDEVRIWNLALSQSNIQSNMNNELCVNNTNLKLYYRLNQGVASGNNTNISTCNDQFGTNNGYLYNFALSGTGSNWVTGQTLANYSNDSTQNISACVSYTLPNGTVVTSNGSFDETLTNVFGCDSVVTYNVNISTVNTAVVAVGNELTSQATSATFQWVNCDNNYDTIPGATSPIFTATANGNYAVLVTENGCVDTSSCYAVTGIGITENHVINAQIYPNPNNGTFKISVEDRNENYTIRIVNAEGKEFYNIQMSDDITDLEVNLKQGVYFVLISGQKKSTTLPLTIL